MADDIREELARWIYTKRWGSPRGYDNPNMDDAFRDDYRAEADDLLALPVIARIRAEALRDAGRAIRGPEGMKPDRNTLPQYVVDDAGSWLFDRAADCLSIRSSSEEDR